MTAKDIANKIALLKGALKKEKNANAKKIIQKKIENLRTQAKTSNISTTALAKQLLGSTRKVANMTDAELQSAINQLKPRSEYAFLKGRIYVKGGVGVKYNLKKVKDDLERYAKPVGWRIKGANNTHRPTPTELAKAKKKGTAYYEDRPDRSDVVRPARLESGGGVNSKMLEIANKWNVVREQVRFAFAKVLGLDRAMEILDRDYSMSPYSIVESAVYSDLILVSEIDKKVIDSAINEAEDTNQMEEIGSSDRTYILKGMLDGAGLKTAFINNRLERVDANGKPMNLKNDLPSSTMFEDGGMMAKGGNVEEGSAHLYIDLRNGNVRIIHGDSVTLKGNPYVLEEVKNVKEGEWLKMVKYIANLKTVK